MKPKDAIQSTMDLSLMVLSTYISDMSDEDLLRRPADGCNHLAWQLGHLISSEARLVNSVCPDAVELPEGFAEKYTKETIDNDNPADFCSKQEYLDLYNEVRAATKKALENLKDEELDGPSPEFLRERFPTVGDLLVLVGSHPMMHAGQFVVVRRQLGKPIMI